MSAAASLPPPPPGPPNTAAMGGTGPGGPPEHSQAWPSEGRPSSASGNAPRVMDHIDDLKAKARVTLDQKASLHVPLRHLLEIAEHSVRSADTFVQYRRPDFAYVDFIVASEILLNRIPRHKGFADLQSQRGQGHRSYRDLLQRIRSEEERFANIRDIIINDNKRTGIQPRILAVRPSTANGINSNSPPYPENSPFPMAGPSNGRYEEASPRTSQDPWPGTSSGRSTPLSPTDPSRFRPPIHPKPNNLQGRPVATSSIPTGSITAADALAERFARLRTTGLPDSGSNRNSLQATPDLAVQMPSPSDYQPIVQGRPMGPRSMPNENSAPPKLPLQTQGLPSLPKEPSPTYSPARNMPTPLGVHPPRSTARSLAGTGGRSNSIASLNQSSHPSSVNGDADSYFPTPPTSVQPTPPLRRASVSLPSELQIEAQKLYDYSRMYNVLLIDVRNREEFDEGHIFATSVMCIEPMSIRQDMSAEQLQDSLVLSPDAEQSFFENRNQYDLVVYYDQSSKDASFLNQPAKNDADAILRNLYNALFEFTEKPLRKPPIMLMGGLNSWIQLVGINALQISRTAAIVAGNQASKASRPIRRVPVASNVARKNLQKRRLRDYNPLDPEEERKWLEQARSERAALENRPIIEEEDIEDDTSSIYLSTSDFLQRYPAIEQQSMMYPPKRTEPEPSRPVPAIPAVPSRPPPAAPRVSYSGVHERNVAPYSNGGRGAQLPAYIPPSHHPRYRLPRTGLINFGVTCYMNSTIQCLNATLPLTRIFLNNSYLNWVQRDNWKGSKGLMSEHYATLIQNLWAGDVHAVRPTSMRKLAGRFNQEWAIDRQQDAKEFLEFLLDILHEDLNAKWSRPPLKPLTDEDEAIREKLPKPYAAVVEWGRYIHRDKSIISDLFAGQHSSRLRCTTCGHTSTTYETFYSLSVEIPLDRPADIRDCLRSYCSEEVLEGDEVWKCPRCKQERKAYKKITITRAPLFLVIHLKRFSASHTERARKVRTQVEFPINGLDLEPFMLPQTTPQEEAVIERQYDGLNQLKLLQNDMAMNPPYLYNAYAVIRHIGSTLASGHYISMVKDTSRGCWRQYNDDKVTDFDPQTLKGMDRLQNEQAYILFYERALPQG